jgi:hypothetical protein
MVIKNHQLLRDLYVGITMVVKNQHLLRDLYAGIVMDVKKLTTITRPICKYCNGYKKTSIYYETYMWVLHI